MLEMEMEFRKGILFVRLEGELNNKTYSKINDDLSYIVRESGIKYLVFNVEKLKSIDINGIDAMLKNYNIISNNAGKVIICGLKEEIVKTRVENSRLLNYLYETSNELSAFNIISL
jgi:stage II sporulation protein AA (anti-sigma F factor antagonist)